MQQAPTLNRSDGTCARRVVHVSALMIWFLGTFWLPIALLFESSFRSIANDLNLDLSGNTPIPAWLIVVGGPILALLAVWALPLKEAASRWKLTAPPLGILLLSLMIYLCTTLIFSGWPSN